MSVTSHAILPMDESWFRKIPAVLHLKDLNSVFIDSTDYFAQLIGYKNADNINGLTDFDGRCKTAEIADTFIKEDKKVLQTGKILTIFYVLSYVNNQTKVMISNKSILRDKAGKIIGTVCQCVDVNHSMILNICNQLHLSDHEVFNTDKNGQLSYEFSTKYENTNLSKRESECLFYLLRGKSYRAMGEILHLSPRTIETHVDHIKNKMGCQNKAEVIEKAIAQGFMSVIPQGVFNLNLALALNE